MHLIYGCGFETIAANPTKLLKRPAKLMNSFTLELHIKTLAQTEDLIVVGSVMNSKDVSEDFSLQYRKTFQTRLP